MKDILLVATGGALGSVLRFWISSRMDQEHFPIGTWLVNSLGCFLIGVIVALFFKYGGNKTIVTFAAVGFCGGFTTFSSFAFQKFKMIESGQFGLALAYLAASVIGGVVMVWLGYAIAKEF